MPVMYKSPSRPAVPVILTDDLVKEKFQDFSPIMKDGAFPVFGRVIGWQRLDNGALGAIVVNPTTNHRDLYGIDFQTGKPRYLGLPKPPKSR